MERYIYIKIKDEAWLTSPLRVEIKDAIERHKSVVEFVEYHINKNDESEENYIDYLE